MRFIQLGQRGNTNATSVFLTLGATLLVFFISQVIALVAALSGIDSFEASDDMFAIVDAMGSNTFLAIQLLPFLCALLTLLLCLKWIHNRPILTVFTSRQHIDWKRFIISASIWMAIMGLSLLFAVQFSDSVEWHFNSDAFIPLLLISLLLVPIQTTCEEVLFRGYLLQLFGSSFKRAWLSVLVTSILFGLIHAGNPEIDYLGYIALLYYIMTGVFLAVLAVMDEGLELSMGFHAANNIFGALILTNDWQAFQTEALFIDHAQPNFGIEMVLSLVVIQPLLLLLYARIFKWSDWKMKLFRPLN